MEFWIGLVIFLISCVVLQYFIQEKYQHIIPKVMMVVLTFLSAFRYGLATDYFAYKILFETVTWSSGIEPSFKIFSVFFRSVGFDFQIIFVVYSILTSIFLWYGFKYYLKDFQEISIAICLYGIMAEGYWQSFNLMRQYLAIAIFIFASRYILERNFLKYAIMIFLMAMVHYTSVILIFCYGVNYIRFNKKIVLLGAGLCFLIGNFNVMPIILERIFDYFEITKYRNYIFFDSIPKGTGISYLFYVVYWLIIVLIMNVKNEKGLYINKLYTIYIYTFFLFSFSYAICRIRYYFVFFGIIAVIEIINQFKPKYKQILICSVIILYSILSLAIIYKDIVRYNIVPNYKNNSIYQTNFNLFIKKVNEVEKQ